MQAQAPAKKTQPSTEFPVGLALFWPWVSLRLFLKPKSTDNWVSKGGWASGFGESSPDGEQGG
jgi:hypothetical protein